MLGPPPQPPKFTFWTLLRSPFTTLHRLLTLLHYLLRLSIFASPTTTPKRRQLSPADTSSRFLREFEELYGQHHIPFAGGKGYAECTRTAKDVDRYLLVVLISEEHDDTAEFLRGVCCDEGFREWIFEEDVLVWGGNIADFEANTGTASLVPNPSPSHAFPFISYRIPPIFPHDTDVNW